MSIYAAAQEALPRKSIRKIAPKSVKNWFSKLPEISQCEITSTRARASDGGSKGISGEQMQNLR